MYKSQIWALLTMLIIGFSDVLPLGGATARALPFFLFSLFCITEKTYLKGWRIYAWVFLVAASFLTMLFHGVLETKDLVLYMVSLCGISFLSTKFTFEPKYIYYFFLIFILPISLFHTFVDGSATWIPVDGVINIYGFGTKHGTASVGLYLLAATLCYLYEERMWGIVEYSKKVLYVLLVFSLYLIVFSSSRSVTLGAAMFVVYLWANRNHFRPKLSVLIFVLCNASVFFLELLKDYVSYINEIPILAEFVHTDNFEQHGVTSGRSWLWGVHMKAFLNSPFLMGGGRAATDFTVGDWVASLNMVANAGSESQFTGEIACYGLIGICLVLIPVGFFFYAVMRKNAMASAIMFCMIYNTTMGQSFVEPTRTGGIIMYMLYFYCLYMYQEEQVGEECLDGENLEIELQENLEKKNEK